jgi:type I restriction enzyme R subunit
LSRLNRTFPGKAETGTFIVDFFNEPEEILESFQPYYQTAELADVTNPDLIFELLDKLRAAGIFQWQEVEQFCEAFFIKSRSSAAIANICKPAVERWTQRYKFAVEAYKQARKIVVESKNSGNPVLIGNAETSFKECKQAKDELDIFKKDLGSFVRFYEFMSQIVDYNDKDLEKLSLFARNLSPMLRESNLDEDDIDLNSVELSHYRLSVIRQQDLRLKEDSAEDQLEPGDGVGGAKPKDKQEELLSQIIEGLNDLFITDGLSEADLVNYVNTISDKVRENELVMKQIANNTSEQALLGDINKAVGDAIMDSSEAHNNQMMQLLSNPNKAKTFARLVFDLLKVEN